MIAVRLRRLGKLAYGDPRGFLVKLRELEPRIAASSLDRAARELRTNKLKHWREAREAALFCHFMSERIGTPVRFAPGESADFDFVATWEDGDTRKYSPVQLKELVPRHLNVRADLSEIIASLSKYTDSSELTVSIYFNRSTHFDPSELKIPKLPIASLWVFGSISSDATRWGLWGDFLDTPVGTQHDYPAA